MKEFPVFTFHGKPLDKKWQKTYISMLLDPSRDRDLFEDEKLNEEFLVWILIKRIKGYKLPFKVTSFFFLMCLTFVDRPGLVMILLRLMYQYWKKTGTTEFNANTFGEMFPFGVPDEEECKEMWLSQKDFGKGRVTENMVDNIQYWR